MRYDENSLRFETALTKTFCSLVEYTAGLKKTVPEPYIKTSGVQAGSLIHVPPQVCMSCLSEHVTAQRDKGKRKDRVCSGKKPHRLCQTSSP